MSGRSDLTTVRQTTSLASDALSQKGQPGQYARMTEAIRVQDAPPPALRNRCPVHCTMLAPPLQSPAFHCAQAARPQTVAAPSSGFKHTHTHTQPAAACTRLLWSGKTCRQTTGGRRWQRESHVCPSLSQRPSWPDSSRIASRAGPRAPSQSLDREWRSSSHRRARLCPDSTCRGILGLPGVNGVKPKSCFVVLLERSRLGFIKVHAKTSCSSSLSGARSA